MVKKIKIRAVVSHNVSNNQKKIYLPSKCELKKGDDVEITKVEKNGSN